MTTTINASTSAGLVQTADTSGMLALQTAGTIHKGDRLVSSNTPGVAQALNINLYQPGCIIGKALEEYNSAGPGVIEVAVGRL